MERDEKQVLTEWLVLGVQAGDEKAFSDLYQLWSHDIRKLAALQLSRKEQIDEVTQDVWLAISRGLRRLHDPACFPRWAFRILDRRCADWVRRRQTERKQAATLEAVATEELSNHPGSNSSDEAAALREAIARLDAESRKLLSLFYDLGFSVVEIAESLNVPTGTVKSRLFSVREKLKHEIERRIPL